jgi:hypothetical protein
MIAIVTNVIFIGDWVKWNSLFLTISDDTSSSTQAVCLDHYKMVNSKMQKILPYFKASFQICLKVLRKISRAQDEESTQEPHQA